MQSFFLDDGFVFPFAGVKPDFGPVGEITYLRTYSRDEHWFQTCERVVNGCYSWQKEHCIQNGRPWDEQQAQHSAQQMYRLMFEMKFLPPGRGLRNMGCEVLEKTGAAANNCGFVSTKAPHSTFAEPFCWAMDMLMLGVGVGFDTLGAGEDLGTPYLPRGPLIFVIDDSREGWVGALRVLLSSYRSHDSEAGRGFVWEFDYSRIRGQGAPIKGFGGIASGPEPLEEMLEGVRGILDGAEKLTSTMINDIMALIGRCVVSGGVRRSAEIAFFESTDTEGHGLKNKSLYPEETAGFRWAANHSIKCARGDDYEQLLENTEGISELGIFWPENAQQYSRMNHRADNRDRLALGCNPCAEQTLEDRELCCLVEIFPSRIESFYEFQKVLKYAYLYAKTVTTIPVHDETTQGIISRNRRIGCSLTGIQEALLQLGSREFYRWCNKGYKYLRHLDERYSEWLDIARSIKITSVKPSGTVSKLPGVSSGIHFPISDSYFQVIRFASNSPYLQPLQRAGYRCVDLSPNEPNTTAVYFGIVDPTGVRNESQVSMWEQAEHAAKLQHYWADNQVSITIKYRPEERGQIPHLLRAYEDRLKAVSFFPLKEHGFSHAPWQPGSRGDVQKYLDSLLPVRYTELENEVEDNFCSGETCTVS